MAPERSDDADLFSGLKKKKKSTKKLNLDGIEDAPTESPPAEPQEAPKDDDVLGDFADMKKKKKSHKVRLDMDAFEKEIAQEGGDKPEGKSEDKPAPAAESTADQDDQDTEASGSVAERAFEAKAWLNEDRDYKYAELLGRFYHQLYAAHPSLSATGAKKRYTLAPPSMHRDGNKRSVFANIGDICQKMHRQPDHVIQFLFAELGTTGSVDGAGRLIIKGRFQQKQIENVLRRYIIEYVTCKTCKSPETTLKKENRLYFMSCESCGSIRTVSAIKTGFQAQTGKRSAIRAAAAA